jgi:hypothetical protein
MTKRRAQFILCRERRNTLKNRVPILDRVIYHFSFSAEKNLNFQLAIQTHFSFFYSAVEVLREEYEMRREERDMINERTDSPMQQLILLKFFT